MFHHSFNIQWRWREWRRRRYQQRWQKTTAVTTTAKKNHPIIYCKLFRRRDVHEHNKLWRVSELMNLRVQKARGVMTRCTDGTTNTTCAAQSLQLARVTASADLVYNFFYSSRNAVGFLRYSVFPSLGRVTEVWFMRLHKTAVHGERRAKWRDNSYRGFPLGSVQQGEITQTASHNTNINQ